MNKLKIFVMMGLILSIILVIGCTETGLVDNNAPTDEDFDVDGVDDFNGDFDIEDSFDQSELGEVVAIVNGEEINSLEVNEVQESFMMQGQQVSEEDVLEELINIKVLEQKVEEEGIIVSTDEAEEMISEQLAMQNSNLDEYKEQLESQGLSYDDELEKIKGQLAIQNYLESQIVGQSFEVSQEEAQEFYEMYKQQSADENIPSFEELEPQIILTLEQQKRQDATILVVQEIRSNANIEYLWK